jgi:hypothetical protein
VKKMLNRLDMNFPQSAIGGRNRGYRRRWDLRHRGGTESPPPPGNLELSVCDNFPAACRADAKGAGKGPNSHFLIRKIDV